MKKDLIEQEGNIKKNLKFKNIDQYRKHRAQQLKQMNKQQDNKNQPQLSYSQRKKQQQKCNEMKMKQINQKHKKTWQLIAASEFNENDLIERVKKMKEILKNGTYANMGLRDHFNNIQPSNKIFQNVAHEKNQSMQIQMSNQQKSQQEKDKSSILENNSKNSNLFNRNNFKPSLFSGQNNNNLFVNNNTMMPQNNFIHQKNTEQKNIFNNKLPFSLNNPQEKKQNKQIVLIQQKQSFKQPAKIFKTELIQTKEQKQEQNKQIFGTNNNMNNSLFNKNETKNIFKQSEQKISILEKPSLFSNQNQLKSTSIFKPTQIKEENKIKQIHTPEISLFGNKDILNKSQPKIEIFSSSSNNLFTHNNNNLELKNNQPIKTNNILQNKIQKINQKNLICQNNNLQNKVQGNMNIFGQKVQQKPSLFNTNTNKQDKNSIFNQKTQNNLFKNNSKNSLFQPTESSIFGKAEQPKKNLSLFASKQIPQSQPNVISGNNIFGASQNNNSSTNFFSAKLSNDINVNPFSNNNLFKAKTQNQNMFSNPGKSLFGGVDDAKKINPFAPPHQQKQEQSEQGDEQQLQKQQDIQINPLQSTFNHQYEQPINLFKQQSKLLKVIKSISQAQQSTIQNIKVSVDIHPDGNNNAFIQVLLRTSHIPYKGLIVKDKTRAMQFQNNPAAVSVDKVLKIVVLQNSYQTKDQKGNKVNKTQYSTNQYITKLKIKFQNEEIGKRFVQIINKISEGKQQELIKK